MTWRLFPLVLLAGTLPAQTAAPMASFPPIHDWTTLQITLRRGACFGNCPEYWVQIDGSGVVTLDLPPYYVRRSRQRSKIPHDMVDALFAEFKRADFFQLQDRYQAPVMDVPSCTLMLSFDGHSKSITESAGTLVGMPVSIVNLENAIDRAAGTRRWLKENASVQQKAPAR